MKIYNKALSVVILALFSSLCFGSCEITFFDVGQGNCSIVSTENEDVFLIDCGSSSHTFKGDDFKKYQIKAISDKITDLLKAQKQRMLNIIISHPDKDHYNWTIEVLSLCQAIMKKEFRVASAYLGGAEKYYEKAFVQFLKSLKGNITFPTEHEATREITKLNHSNGAFELLPALPCESKTKSNDCSLVVRITHGNRSCIITGDATKISTRHIIENCGRLGYNLASDIVQASHHGAEDDCNSPEWIAALKPQHVIFSSGFHEGYLHPRTMILHRYQDHASSDKYHVLYSGIKKKSDDAKVMPIYGMNREHYGVLATTSNMYSTLNQGTITFQWSLQNELPLTPVCTSGEFFSSEKECVLQSLAHPTIDTKFFGPEKMVRINLESLGIDDDLTQDKELLHALFALLAGNNSSLKKIYLSNNRLRDFVTHQLLKKLIQKKQVRVFEVENCDIPEGTIVELRNGWDNRGFKG